MKKIVFLLIAVLIFTGIPDKNYAQTNFTVNLQILQPLPELDFAALAFVNSLSGAPRIFVVRIDPKGEPVRLRGAIKWRKAGSNVFEDLYTFETETFLSRNLTNQEIGNSDIKLRNSNSVSHLQNQNFEKGKPTGAYRIEITVVPESGSEQSIVETLEFLNPSQTLTIRSPLSGSSHNIGSVFAEWDQIQGTSAYKIKANIRNSASQSLEEALNSGDPLIDDREVGTNTFVNLREILEREWLPGEEVVFRVSAQIPGPSGGNELLSNIVNFYIDNPESPFEDAMINNFLSILETLPHELRSNTELLTNLASGDVTIVEIIREDGTKLTRPEIDELVRYLQLYPEAIISLSEND